VIEKRETIFLQEAVNGKNPPRRHADAEQDSRGGERLILSGIGA
jgi:hypothetical protein